MSLNRFFCLTFLLAHVLVDSLFASQTSSEQLCKCSAVASVEPVVRRALIEKEQKELKNKVYEEISVIETCAQEEFLDFDDTFAKERMGSELTYYREYGACRVTKNMVSCPLDLCDPLESKKSLDGLTYFLPSAAVGWVQRTVATSKFAFLFQEIIGMAAIEVLDEALTEIRVVRAHGRDGRWVQIYLGYNPQLCTSFDDAVGGRTYWGNEKMYTAQILMIQRNDPKSQKPLQEFPQTGTPVARRLVLKGGQEILSTAIYWNVNTSKLKRDKQRSKQTSGAACKSLELRRATTCPESGSSTKVFNFLLLSQ